MGQSHHLAVRIIAAWLVHALTTFGAVAGLFALLAITEGHYKTAFLWMAVTLFIDSIDGFLARRARVREFAPAIDGALLDNLVDYFTYVIVPAVFIAHSDLVPAKVRLLTASAITVASAYQFAQTKAKTADHYFKGFPSYWNIAVFYLHVLAWPSWINLAVLWLLAVAVFVPIKYLYPSRAQRLRMLTLFLTCTWGVCMVILLLLYPRDPWRLRYWTLAYVAYYISASIVLTLTHAMPRRKANA